ncbi:MAG TPA: hypothetical protein V6C71_04335 [Coleofasciculaceae cyanobacterium]|jgi:hypothetical protein
MNKLLVGQVSSIILLLLGVNPAKALPLKSQSEPEKRTKFTFTPLSEQLFSQPTAKQLGNGEMIVNLNTRTFFFPDLVENRVDNEDSAVNFNTGFSWGISDELQLSLQFQHVDSSSPIEQGEFTSERTEDNEAALEFKGRIWNNQSETIALSGVIAASWGTRGFRFSRSDEVTEINNRDIFVALAFPISADVGDRWQFNLAPTMAFFKDESAVFFHRLPDDQDSSFGTVLGIGGAVSYRVSSKLFIFSDVFLPLTGNNSINRDSGKPDRAIAYNAGLRYLTNPRLALDLYATNTFASFAPLSLTADRDFMGLGANLVFMPDVVPANRQYSDFKEAPQTEKESITRDGLAFFDGGTLPSGKLAVQLQGGSQGVLTAIRYGLLKDLEAGIFLDYVAGEVDESEQGISGKVRFLNQNENAPITLSALASASLTNEPFVNFFENDATTFERRDLDKTIPIFTPGGDDASRGKRLILTFALPIHYEVDQNVAVWFTPVLGYVQRLGTEIGGFNLGGAIAVDREISFTGEVGANFLGEGNSLIDGQLKNKIPWTVGVRWIPLSLLDRQAAIDNSDPYLELYLTNRVGSSTWHQLRVRENNDIGVGVGLFLPFSW